MQGVPKNDTHNIDAAEKDERKYVFGNNLSSLLQVEFALSPAVLTVETVASCIGIIRRSIC